ncbi:MAG: hypothetical protein H3C39_03425 [Flavobacteriia bacterium]|nr:hypothetical protein [Flavobacteriia bacterium]
MGRILIFILLIFNGCSINNKESKSIKAEFFICGIDEFTNFYRFKGFIDEETDTVYAISYKEKPILEAVPNITIEKKIEPNKRFHFIIEKIKPRIFQNNYNSQFIIIGDETLWKGSMETTPPNYYIIKNAAGMKLFRINK